MILTAAQNTQPDYVALAMVAVLAIIVIVMAIRKKIAVEKKALLPAEAVPPAQEAEWPAAPGSAGQVKLHSVPPKTAAMLMAIVADKTGKPLNQLRFISIKEVE